VVGDVVMPGGPYGPRRIEQGPGVINAGLHGRHGFPINLPVVVGAHGCNLACSGTASVRDRHPAGRDAKRLGESRTPDE
jgi:hypothetical protein